MVAIVVIVALARLVVLGGGEAACIFYQNNRKNRYAIRHIGKETKYINLWDYINLRNSSAEGTIIR